MNKEQDKEKADTIPDVKEKVSAVNNSIKSFLSTLTLDELEVLNEQYKKNLNGKLTTKVVDEKKGSLQMYSGKPHELNINNLLTVMDEVGISNQLFVLAQALLETGYFKSDVCIKNHNLFGLYDSKHKRYYSFSNWESSVVGYKEFVQYRYNGGNYLAFLKRIGYAEDPRYLSKVNTIFKKLCKNDRIGECL